MPSSPSALAPPSAPRHSARGPETRARLPALLEALLLALLARLLGRPELTARAPWHHPTGHSHLNEPPGPRSESKRARRLRAWVGWILRGLPGLGMAPCGRAPAPPPPARTARAPPRPHRPHARPESVAKTPPPAAPTHALIPSFRTK